jgi:uncharacterized protein YfaS (alpha-2-macroglobulin family)
MALGKALRQLGTADYRGDIAVNGTKRADFTTENFAFTDSALGDKEITLSIQGEGTCFFFWEARGIPIGQQFVEEDIGLEVRRFYYTIDNKSIDPESIPHGELVVAEITINSPDQSVENVIIDDMLPAGLEMENPRLSSRASISWITDDAPTPDYIDIRDDRILLFTSVKQGEKKRFYYALRAVTLGTFVMPPISAECMYDPTLKSIAGSGFIKILP